MISKLTLGTAQLGQKYGIANTIGKPSERTAVAILSTALDNGINCIDTAPVYGDSEKIIGKYFSYHPRRCTVITKLPSLNIKEWSKIEYEIKTVRDWWQRSSIDLGMVPIPIYMVRDLSELDIIYKDLIELKRERLVSKFGVSIYKPSELEKALQYDIFEALEIPINLFDHRFIPYLPKLKGKIVFARSVFLQGLLMANPYLHFPITYEPLSKLKKVCNEFGTNIREAAVSFVRDLPNITSLVIGTETVNQVLDNVELIKSLPLSDNLHNYILSEFADMPLEVIDPRRWK